jgi:UDPglucose--hexose-1-phosphate uridylyltransferase
VIAAGRATRPGARRGVEAAPSDPAACPFCEGHEDRTPPEVDAMGRPAGGLPDTPGWTVRVVPNKYPAFPGQEVAIHGPAHATRLADTAPGVAEAMATAWLRRRDHHLAAGAGYVLCSINEGIEAGASLEHSHSQILPLPDVPPLPAAEAASFAAASGCPLCELLAHGAPVGVAGGLAAVCPPWSQMPYETWIVPTAHAPHPDDPAQLGAAIRDAARRLGAVLGDRLAWNAILHDGPPGDNRFHWHVEVLPRLTVAAAVELGAGIWVNVTDPALAADELRATALR